MGNKSVNNLYKPMLEHSNVEQKFHKAAKGKTERPDVAVILEPTNIQRHVKNVVEQLENTAPEGYDVPHPEKAWKPSRHGKVCINEGTSRKVRMIEKPRYNYEQVIHHIVVSACYDIFMKGMYEFSCGSVPNRGAHYGKKYIERWIQRDKKNCKYVLKMDIRHFFESVDHDVLKAWLKKKIRDERMLYILELIIDGSEVGLPLGFYTSQWLSNFMLQPLDHFIKEQLKAVHYIRYMDDMVVFGKNKKELHRMQQEIERFLREKVQLADERKLAGVPVRLHREKDRKEKRETTRFHGIPVLSRQDDSAGKHHVELHTESQPCRKERENHMVRCNRNSVIHGLLEQYRHIRHVPAKGQALCEC